MTGTKLFVARNMEDIDVTSLQDGYTLIWSDAEGSWIVGTPPSSYDQLSDLEDCNISTPSDGDVLTWNSSAGEWIPGNVRRMVMVSFSGVLVTGMNNLRLYNKFGKDLTIVSVFISVDTAPTGAAIICDVHLDGTTIFTTQSNRPQIAISGFTGESVTIENDAWDQGSYLQAGIDQIGSTIAGADLTIEILAI